MGVSQLRTAMAWQRVNRVADAQSLVLRDSRGFHLIPELQPLPSEAIFDKLSMSFFAGTPLDMALRDCGVSTFAIVGLVLEIGIEPTVSHGADRFSCIGVGSWGPRGQGWGQSAGAEQVA